MSNYKIINTYSENEYNSLISKYENDGCDIYVNFYGATEIYSSRVCLAVIHKNFS